MKHEISADGHTPLTIPVNMKRIVDLFSMTDHREEWIQTFQKAALPVTSRTDRLS
jgi:hypothetical protein